MQGWLGYVAALAAEIGAEFTGVFTAAVAGVASANQAIA